MLRRSAPIITLSLAFSKSSIVTKRRPIARGHQRRLVHQVGQVRTREARGFRARSVRRSTSGPKRHLAGVDRQDLLAALDIGVRHVDLAVKAARTQQGRVQHVLAGWSPRR